MKTTIIAFGTALIFGISGYVLGGYNGVTRMARASNYATLMWLTNIDKDLQQGNIDRAKKLTFQATDATFGVLERIDTTPESALLAVVPWAAFNIKAFNEQIATRAKQHFTHRFDEFSEPSKSYIQKIVEVELPKSSCPVKK
jgi:hypothetical protein